jgi:hypothetical protein
MAMTKRERLFTFGCLLTCGVLAADRLAVTPYMDARAALIRKADARAQALNDAQDLLAHERRLRRLLTAMGPTIELDASAAEVRLVRLLNEWEQQSGLTNATFHRVRAADDAQFTLLTFHASAGGDMAAAARLLYAIETAPIPLRVEGLTLTPRKDGAELQIQLNVSTLCRKGGAPLRPRGPAVTPPAAETASAEIAGGRP